MWEEMCPLCNESVRTGVEVSVLDGHAQLTLMLETDVCILSHTTLTLTPCPAPTCLFQVILWSCLLSPTHLYLYHAPYVSVASWSLS